MARTLDEAIDQLQGEMDEAALMGAARRVMAQRGGARTSLSPEQQRSATRLTSGFAAGGVPTIGMRRQVAPLGEVTFTATSGQSLNASATPTKNLIGRKLVVSVTRNGTSATAAVALGYVTIGSNNQFVTDAPAPAELFAPEVQGNNIDFDQAQAGVPMQVGVNLNGPALTGTDTIRVVIGMLADTIG